MIKTALTQLILISLLISEFIGRTISVFYRFVMNISQDSYVEIVYSRDLY